MKKVAIGLLIYILTGIAQPILIDTLRIHSLLGHKYLLLPTLANTTGMALCGLLASKSQWRHFKSLLFHKSISSSSISSSSMKTRHNHNHITHSQSQKFKQRIILAAFVDLISGMCLTFGILLTGGAIFVILYNSCPAWTAMLSKFILGKQLTYVQLMGVMLVCLGLIANLLGTKVQKNHGGAYGIVFGSVIVLVGSLLHSLMFVLSDLTLRSLKSSDHNSNGTGTGTGSSAGTGTGSSAGSADSTPRKVKNGGVPSTSSSQQPNVSISGDIWSCCLGLIETSFMTLWVLFGIMTTGFHQDTTDTIDANNNTEHQQQWSMVLIGFISLVIIDAAHAAAFFALLQNIGAVASALIKGVQAVVVVLLSAVFFCAREESQCLTSTKAFSAALVLSGVFAYGVGGKKGSVDTNKKVRVVMKKSLSDKHISISSNVVQSKKGGQQPVVVLADGKNIELKPLIKT